MEAYAIEDLSGLKPAHAVKELGRLDHMRMKGISLIYHGVHHKHCYSMDLFLCCTVRHCMSILIIIESATSHATAPNNPFLAT